MGGIFINYRRDDSSGYAGRVYGALEAHFPHDLLFMDVDSIDPGLDFLEVIEQALAQCVVMLVIIGKDWVETRGQRRLEDPDDYVRLEIEHALARKIRVIPVLVKGATMPTSPNLPQSLVSLIRRNAVELSDTRWEYDTGKLVEALKKYPVLKFKKNRTHVSQPKEGKRELSLKTKAR